MMGSQYNIPEVTAPAHNQFIGTLEWNQKRNIPTDRNYSKKHMKLHQGVESRDTSECGAFGRRHAGLQWLDIIKIHPSTVPRYAEMCGPSTEFVVSSATSSPMALFVLRGMTGASPLLTGSTCYTQFFVPRYLLEELNIKVY